MTPGRGGTWALDLAARANTTRIKSGLRDDFRDGDWPQPGPARPALRAWAALPGAREP